MDELTGLEEADDAVLTVVPGRTAHVPAAQAPDRLAEELAADRAISSSGTRVRMSNSEPSSATRVATRPSIPLLLRADAADLPEHLGKLDEVGDVRPSWGTVAFGPVGEFLDTVQHTDGEGLGTLRAQSGRPAGSGGVPIDAACAVPVRVILALLGEELDRPV